MTAPARNPILLKAPDGAEVWTIVELQGSIESKAALNGVEFAHLSWEANSAAPSLIFGKQKIAGSWASLKKPLAIMAQSARSDTSAKVEGAEGSTCEYHARGVVREKLIFKGRPKPITRTPAAAASTSKRVRLDGPEGASPPGSGTEVAAS